MNYTPRYGLRSEEDCFEFHNISNLFPGKGNVEINMFDCIGYHYKTLCLFTM